MNETIHQPKPIRIWQQSISELDELPRYRTTLREQADRVTRPSTCVEIHGMRPGSYPGDLAPIEALASPWNHYLANAQIVQGAVEAEASGFDAVAVTCYHDPALPEARSAVQIPVVSMCESSLLTAAALGRYFGLVGIDATNVRLVKECVRAYELTNRVVDVLPVTRAVNEHEIEATFGIESALTDGFRETARRTIAAGAEVLIPCETVLNTALARQGVRDVDGVPVLDGYAAMLAHAEMLVQLRRATGMVVPRPGTPKASSATDTLRRAAANSLAQELLINP